MKKLAFVLAVVLTLGLFAVANAECNPGDLYCQGWTPNQQEQKVRIEDMELYNLQHKDLLNGCDAACVANYNDVTGGLFKAVATKNNLPYDQFVKYAIALNYEWGRNAESALKRPLTLKDWQNRYPWGWWDLTQSLTINPVMRVWDDSRWCVYPDYGGAGTCPGLW